ncbi:hypothetical protein BDZ91DRAFT_788658 [Kalaharituber pfeilii]|nr:hypothetical protein BDZ91DRAFT_788658 [Kalaharituber pfeilii]
MDLPSFNRFAWLWKPASPPSPPPPPPPAASTISSRSSGSNDYYWHPTIAMANATKLVMEYICIIHGEGQTFITRVAVGQYIDDLKKKIKEEQDLKPLPRHIKLYKAQVPPGKSAEAGQYPLEELEFLKPDNKINSSYPFASGSQEDVIVVWYPDSSVESKTEKLNLLEAYPEAHGAGELRRSKLRQAAHARLIFVYGPLFNNKALWFPPIERDPIPEVLALAFNSKPSILHAPYHSGKTTCLWAIHKELQNSGIQSAFVSLDDIETYDVNLGYLSRFTSFISNKIFGEDLSNESLRNRLSIEYGKGHGQNDDHDAHPRFCLLIDELQALFHSPELAITAKSFLKFLGNNFIPYVGAGTFKITELDWDSTNELDSPFNKVGFFCLKPLSLKEMGAIFEEYRKSWKVTVPEDLQLDIMGESGGHAASFMALLKLFHDYRPTKEAWRRVLELQYLEFMNGVSKKIRKDLAHPVVRQLVRKMISWGEESWSIDLKQLDSTEYYLLNVGVFVLVGNKVKFTSALILRACIEVIFPKPTKFLTLQDIHDPVILLRMTLRHINPAQLKSRLSYNKAGPSESSFHFELYAILRNFLPNGWLCTAEVRIAGQQKKLDLLVQGEEEGNWAGYELRVNHLTNADFTKPVEQCTGYYNQHKTTIYLVNFCSKATSNPHLVNTGAVVGINIRYSDSFESFDIEWWGGKTVVRTIET